MPKPPRPKSPHESPARSERPAERAKPADAELPPRRRRRRPNRSPARRELGADSRSQRIAALQAELAALEEELRSLTGNERSQLGRARTADAPRPGAAGAEPPRRGWPKPPDLERPSGPGDGRTAATSAPTWADPPPSADDGDDPWPLPAAAQGAQASQGPGRAAPPRVPMPQPSQGSPQPDAGVPAPRPSTVWQPALSAHDATRELLTSDYFVRQWGRLAVRQRSEGRDEFGLDPDAERRYAPLLKLLLRNYFRARVEGVEHIPSEGRCLVVANHSGGPVPYDGLLLRTALRLEHPEARELRWLTEDLFHHLPWIGSFMTRLGAVRACQENAQRLLRRGHVVAVFPEGLRALGRPYPQRYRLERFGRGGFVRLCLRTQTPLVPCAIVGAEDANPLLYRLENATRFLGIPYLPITPTFPWLGPIGLLPGPAKLLIRFGEPVSFEGYSPESADDDLLVGRMADRVRATIQGLLDEALARRRSVFFG